MTGTPTPRRKRPDPTKVTNQKALRTSDGKIWLLMGGLFTLAAGAGFGMLIATPDRQSTTIAWVCLALVVALYVVLVIAQFTVRSQVTRLRVQAGCMLTMAIVSVAGMYLCIVAEGVGG